MPASNFILRDATEADLRAIVEIYNATIPNSPSLQVE
jgi:L-amino acid N-acyltransferase YncA